MPGRPSYYNKNARVAGILTAANPLRTEFGVGAVAGGSAVSVIEQGDGVLHKTIITLTNLSVTMTDQTTAGSQGSQKVYDFPEQLLAIMGASMNLTIARVGTNLQANAAVVASLGTAAAGTGDATLTSTEADIIPSTSATLSSGAGSAPGKSTAGSTLDGTSTAKDAILNFAVPDAGSAGNDALLVNGTITIVWIGLGDV